MSLDETNNEGANALQGARIEERAAGDHVVRKLEWSPEEYMEKRVNYKIDRYGEKANRYRNVYWAMAIIAAVGSALVPVLINIQDMDPIYPTIVSVIVAITVALERVFRPREIWRNYGLVRSLLSAEEMRFRTKTGSYARGNPNRGEVEFAKFVERIEDSIANEREETIVMRTTPPSEGPLNRKRSEVLG